MRAPLNHTPQRRRRLSNLSHHVAQVGLKVCDLNVSVVVASPKELCSRKGAVRMGKPEDVLEAAAERRVADVQLHEVAPQLLLCSNC